MTMVKMEEQTFVQTGCEVEMSTWMIKIMMVKLSLCMLKINNLLNVAFKDPFNTW
jgi:hypothetical protein